MTHDAPGLQSPPPSTPRHLALLTHPDIDDLVSPEDMDYAEFVAALERQMPTAVSNREVGSPFWNGTPARGATPPAVTRGGGPGRAVQLALLLGMLASLAWAGAHALLRGTP